MRCCLACPKSVRTNWDGWFEVIKRPLAARQPAQQTLECLLLRCGFGERLANWLLRAGDCPSKELALGVNEQPMRGGAAILVLRVRGRDWLPRALRGFRTSHRSWSGRPWIAEGCKVSDMASVWTDFSRSLGEDVWVRDDSAASASPCETSTPTSMVDTVDGERWLHSRTTAAAEGNDLHPSQGRIGRTSESKKPLNHAVERRQHCRFSASVFEKRTQGLDALADRNRQRINGSQGYPAGWSQNIPLVADSRAGRPPPGAVRAGVVIC